MSTESILDFESLLAPISEEAPSGPSLREHPELSRTYYAVREARNAAMEAERVLARLALLEQRDHEQAPGGQEESRPVPHWGKVIDLAIDLLSKHSKDLWAVSWLIEALTRQAGLAGFRDGLKLCRLLSEQYWSTIHPRPDEEEGYGHTVAQLAGLDNTLSSALESIAMLPTDSRLTWANYQFALDMEQMDPDLRSTRIDEGAVSLNSFEQAVRDASREDLLCTLADLDDSIEECKSFSDVMDTLCGKDESGHDLSPPTGNLVRTLERLRLTFSALTSGLLEDADDDSDNSVVGELTEGERERAGADSANLMQRPVASRDEALQHLLRVADFFRKSEPHSPVSYALEQAVRWGRMPLPDLLRDLVSDDTVLAQVFKRMGIARPTDNEDHADE
ncbi:MAG: type VI secretion system protein TssA [Pirellulaceae bacterium]